MDEYVRIMAVNQLKWLNDQKNVVNDVNDEAVRQRKWLSDLNLSVKDRHPPASSASIVNSNNDSRQRLMKHVKVAKLSNNKADVKASKKPLQKYPVKSVVRPLSAVEKNNPDKPPRLKNTKEQEVQTAEVNLGTIMFNRPSSSLPSRRAHASSPKIAQKTGINESGVIDEDTDKRGIENDKDLINTSLVPPSADKQSIKKSLKSDKQKMVEPPPKLEEASTEKPKKERHYDIEATRNFMKQKRTERQQQAQVAKEVKSKTKDKSEIKSKLQELRNKQLNILKNSAKRRKDEQPEWVGVGSSDGPGKVDASEVVLITAPEKVKKELPPTKPKRIIKPPVRKTEKLIEMEPAHPPSFYDDVNFPAEFIMDKVDEKPRTFVPKGKSVVKNVPEGQILNANQPKQNLSPSHALKYKQQKSDSQVAKSDEVNMILQEEIKQGLEATNEFMNQVSEQMKLLTEHFKLVNDSKVADPGGVPKSVLSKDTEIQGLEFIFSDSIAADKNQEVEGRNKINDGWKDITYCINGNNNNSKRGSSQAQKFSLMNELFFGLDNVSPRSQEMSVRRRLDFIQQSTSIDVQAYLEHEIMEKGLSSQLISSPPTQVQKLAVEENEDAKFTSTFLSPKRSSSKSSKSNKTDLPDQEMNGDKSFHTLEKISGGKSDTTISESLSTDPLKLADNVDNLALNTEPNLPKASVQAEEVVESNVQLSTFQGSESSKIRFNDIKLDTNLIEGLQIKTPPLLDKKKSKSISTLSHSMSEISDKLSQVGSECSSKSNIQISHKQSGNKSLTDISEKCDISNYSKKSSKHDSFAHLKSIQESIIENSLKEVNSHSNEKPLSPKSEISDVTSIKTDYSKRSESDRLAVPLSVSEQITTGKERVNDLSKSKKYSSLEDLVVKSDKIETVSVKSFSEKKVKESSHSLQKVMSEVSFTGLERHRNKSVGRTPNHSDSECNKGDFDTSTNLRRQSSNFFNIELANNEFAGRGSQVKKSKTEHCRSLPGTSTQFNDINYLTNSNKPDMFGENSDSSSGFTLLQPITNVNFQRSSKSKKRSSDKNLQKMFYDGVSFTSASSNSAQIGSFSFHDQILKEMENLDAVNTNLSHALARNRALSTDNLAIFSNISTSASVGGIGENEVPNYPLQLSHSDTTNNLSFGSSGFDARRESHQGLKQVEDPSINLSKFSLRMLENLLVDEELRYQNQASLLEMRKQAILEKTKAELTLLSVERVQQKARGNEEMLRSIKKKERGIIMKCHQDFHEIKRLHKVGKEASRDRILLFKSQIHLLKSHLSTNKYAQILSTGQVNKNLRKGGHSPSKAENFKQSPKSVSQYISRASLETQKRELERREAVLAAKRQSLEAVMTWTKRVEEEEKRLKDMEKLITLSSHTRQVLKQGVDRGTSPLNLVCDSEFSGNKAVESSASSSEQQIDTKLKRKTEVDQSTDNYSDTFEQISSCEHVPQTKKTDSATGDAGRRKSVVAIKVPLSPRIPPTKRRHSSGSDESILYSQNETSETSDIEVRVTTLQQQLKQRKSELELLKRRHSKSQREKLRATEQALISQINAYDGYIKQLKNEMQELDNGTVKVVKPQIKQPKFAERRKSEPFPPSDRKKDLEQKDIATSEEVELSESTESVKTLVESPRIKDDLVRSSTEDSIRTDNDMHVSEDIKTESLEHDISDNNFAMESSTLQTESIIKTASESLIPEEVKPIIDIASEEVNSASVQHTSEEISQNDLDVSGNIKEEPEIAINEDEINLDSEVVSEIFEKIESKSETKQIDSGTESEEVLSEIDTDVKEKLETSNHDEILEAEKSDLPIDLTIKTSFEPNSEPFLVNESINKISSEVSSLATDELEKEAIKSDISSVSDSEEVKTESLIRSLESSENKDILIINIDVKNKEKELAEDENNEILKSNLPDEDKKDSDVETSFVTDLSNLEHLYSNEESKFDSELSPISSLHSGENVNLMSAALIRAIEETKEKEKESVSEELESSIEDRIKSIVSKYEESEDIHKADLEEPPKDVSTSKVHESTEIINDIPEDIEVENSLTSDHALNDSPCDKTFIVNKDESFGENELMSEEDAEDLMLRMISETYSDSERLWTINVDDYRKIREETPFLTALQRENDVSNTINTVSQRLFRNLYENGVSDVLRVYAGKKESALRDELDQYHLPDFDYCKDDTKEEAEEEKFWCNASCGERKETPPTADEAEKLRLKQLQIEQEIKELEAAGMRAFYLREIPNKPPPPYMPPRPVKSRPTRQVVSDAVELGINTLWECEHLESLDSLKPPSNFLVDMMEYPDSMYRDMMWDLCLELFRKVKPVTPPPTPPWLMNTRRKKLAPPPRSKEGVIQWCTRQANLVFGYEASIKKENMLIRWSHKKRDRVDQILVRESQEEETDWVDYTVEENLVKNRITESVIDGIVEDATKAILNAFLKKLST